MTQPTSLAILFCLLALLCLDSPACAQGGHTEQDVQDIMAGSDPILDTLAEYDGWNQIYSADGWDVYHVSLDGAEIDIGVFYDDDGITSVAVHFDYNDGHVVVDYYFNGSTWSSKVEGSEDNND